MKKNGYATKIGLAAAALMVLSSGTLSAAVRTDRPRSAEGDRSHDEAAAGKNNAASEAAPARKQVPWLGLVAEEAPEVVSAQLGLDRGEGLVVVRVDPDSPAAKVGLERNDVLVELGDQRLVHPAQLRKLVLARKPGDEVRITYYRAGKQDQVTATIGATDEAPWKAEIEELPQRWRDSVAGPLRDQMRNWRESLDRAGVNGEAIREQVRRSMEQARKAIEEAMQQATNHARHSGPGDQELQNLSRRNLEVDKNASVTVQSHGSNVKTSVKSDDSGSYVIVADPRKRLTAHNRDGKLLFDGPIETPDEQARVPREVWEHVQPMLEQMK